MVLKQVRLHPPMPLSVMRVISGRMRLLRYGAAAAVPGPGDALGCLEVADGMAAIASP